jgi:hypothetical protein
MSQNETPAALKARKLAEMREELVFISSQKDPGIRTLRQGLVSGRLLELQEFGVFTWQESNALAKEMQLLLGVPVSKANGHDASLMKATIDWVSVHESNTPRGEVTDLKIGLDSIVLKFRGTEGGQGSSWSGSVKLKRTVGVQTIIGHYEDTPHAKMKGVTKSVGYTLLGCFSDDTYQSFTGTWTEGVTTLSDYEFNIDIG